MVSAVSHQAQEYVTVEIQEGPLRGQVSKTFTDKAMFMFEGIPYAEPPVGDLRFQPPVAKAAWSDVRDALALGSHCPQIEDNEAVGNEDCLHLNVYGPEAALQKQELKAAMVWIHGGCFTGTSGDSAIPNYYVDQDVVFVSINYRLGLLGFLSTGDEVVPGNMGLKDQTEALRWVQRNIAVFGGDPEKVTIFGQSAGGASIHYHVVSPLSTGLFKNAIAMSGSSLNPWAFSKNATDRAIRFAQYLGYTGKTSNDLVNFLKNVDPKDLVTNANVALSEEDSKTLFTCVWVPSAEPVSDGAFLTEEPWIALSEGRYNLVPFMTGNTDLERVGHTQPGGSLSTEAQIENLNENFGEIVGCDLRLPTKEERLEGAESVKEFYYNGSDITLKDNYTTALFDSHLFFVEGVDAAIRSMSRLSSQPVYYYQFSYVGPLSLYPGGPGAAHADDMRYMYTTPTDLDPDSDGGIIRAQMIEMWANFAKYDNPTPEQTSLLTEVWKEYNDSSQYYLEITRPLRLKANLFEPYMIFWKNLLPS
ncbi:venom carboxylesterase-6-like [Schistocerca americana]|uniref:venom carboxylesterase-6-like n=1 Tax=Schistocerca americana TaxID=7009 RepID=UPI001F502F04|nr:venom carboxylesterase-6-like [Schistocerca americana]